MRDALTWDGVKTWPPEPQPLLATDDNSKATLWALDGTILTRTPAAVTERPLSTWCPVGVGRERRAGPAR